MDTRLSLLHQVTGSDGSDEAWAELVDLYQPLVAGWLRRYNLRPDDVEDVSQEVMSMLVRQLDDFDHNGRIGAFRNWLRQVTVNRATEFFRRNRRQAPCVGGSSFHDMLEQLRDPVSEVSRLFNREHDLHLLAKLLLRVSSEFKPQTMSLFRMHVMLARDANDIAQEQGITPHAVYMAKSRIMRRLRQLAPGVIEAMEGDGQC